MRVSSARQSIIVRCDAPKQSAPSSAPADFVSKAHAGRGRFATRFACCKSGEGRAASHRGDGVPRGSSVIAASFRCPPECLHCHPEYSKDLVELLDSWRLDLHRKRSLLVRVVGLLAAVTQRDPSRTQDDKGGTQYDKREELHIVAS